MHGLSQSLPVAAIAAVEERKLLDWGGSRFGNGGGTPPGSLYEYQKTGVANWAVRKCMKTKEEGPEQQTEENRQGKTESQEERSRKPCRGLMGNAAWEE